MNFSQIFREEFIESSLVYNKTSEYESLHIEKPDRQNGLVLKIFNSEGYIDHYCNRMQEGYKIIFHSPDEYPNSKMHSNVISFDSLTDIILSPSIHKIDDRIKSLSVDTRQCYLEDERQLKYYKIYNKHNCEQECLLNMTLSLVNCSIHILPIIPDYKMCNLSDPKINLKELRSMTANDSCNCLPNCDVIIYNVEINQLKSNISEYNNILDRILRASFGINDSLTNDKINEISIFYRQSKFIVTKKTAKIWWTDFIADCGGLLGLFMGVSILSIVEIFYFLVNSLFNKVF